MSSKSGFFLAGAERLPADAPVEFPADEGMLPP